MGENLKKPLTERQKEVLALLTIDMLTQAEISRRLGISRAGVSKHVTTLRKAGFLGVVNTPRLTPGGVARGSESVNLLRLHGEEYRVGILRDSSKYHETRRRADSVLVEGNRVVLHRDLIMLYVNQSFYGETVEDCERAAGAYLVRLLNRLESLYGVLLLRERSENVKRVKAHYAETGNELAQGLRQEKESVRIFGSRDGKEWLLFDDSLKLDEAETTHSPTSRDSRGARDDMAKVMQPYFNDHRDNVGRVMLPSQVMDAFSRQIELNLQQAQLFNQQMQVNSQNSQTFQQVTQAMMLVAQGMHQKPPEEPRGLDPDEPKPGYFG